MVSIIIPCYKADRFLAETLESVRQQTYSDWEVIVVEDGSKDRTEDIVECFRAKNPSHPITYHRLKTNRGPSAARNAGIQLASGPWLAFLDSDDLWRPEHLETLLTQAKQQQTDLVYCSVEFFDSKTGIVSGLWGPTDDDLKQFPDTLFARNFISPSGVLVKRATLVRTALFEEDSRIQSCEDHDLWMTLLEKGVSFGWVPYLKVAYRKNHLGAATSNQERMFRADLAVMYRHLRNPCFGFTTKCKGLSQNYALLAEALLEKRKWNALFFYLRSWCFNPLELRRLKRLIKAFGLLSFRLAG